MTSWLDNIDLTTPVENGPNDWFRQAIFKESIENETTLWSSEFNGYISDEDYAACKEFLVKKGATCIYDKSTAGPCREEGVCIFAWKGKKALANFYDYGHTESVNFAIRSTDKALVDDIAKFIRSKCIQQEQEDINYAKIFINTDTGPKILRAGRITTKLTPVNYSDDVLSGFEHLKKDLISDNPCGRFSLLEGQPGTGKSFFIKSLMTSTPTASFIFIPNTMAGNLTGPAFFGALLQEKNNPMSNTSRPVVLVLEDADASIVSRGINKAPHIAEILNLGDGIFGDVANIRIVATTNAKTVDVDDALLRPGRLCSHVKFDKLTPAHSKKVYKEICGKDLKEKGGFTLAEIYKMANENIVLEKKDEKVAGQYL